ncbi:MAG: hypothetical protein LWW91_01620 [Bacteroidales bacterium]|nr:hypothetical protein [Bacteroidales bacterium]
MNNTKRFFLIPVLIACTCLIMGQDNWRLDKNMTVYSTNLDAYVGEWEYREANEVFRIHLKKGKLNISHSSGECLIGDYFYQSDGVIFDSYTPNKIPAERNSDNGVEIVIYANNANINIENSNPNVLYMLLRDKRFKKSSYSCKIFLLSENQIRWYLVNDEGPVDEDFIDGFSIPTDVILTKVR